MSIDFSTLQGLTIPEGVVTQITDASGRVLWALNAGGPVSLEVAKITSDTYAGETTYTGEQFILLDIYPKTNGTVKVTYGGLTKTITDTSGAEEPNAQQVYFGTFYGVSDSVATPENGELTIEGDYYAFGASKFNQSKIMSLRCACICKVISFGEATLIPSYFVSAVMASGGSFNQTSITIPSTIKSIGDGAFHSCQSLLTVSIGKNVEYIGNNAFTDCTGLTSIDIPEAVTSIGNAVFSGCTGLTSITVASGNTTYYSIGNCLIETATQTLIIGLANSAIPEAVTSIGNNAFADCTGLTSIDIPEAVTSIGNTAFSGCTGLTSINIPEAVTSIGNYAFSGCTGLTSVTFDNTSGWYVTETNGGDVSTGTAVDVTDTANNVTLITDTYKSYYWYRSA